MREQLTRLKDRLNDLSLRNRSIRLLKLNKKWNVDLLQLDGIQGDGGTEKILGAVLSRREKVSLLRITSGNRRMESMGHRLTTLYRNLRQIEEETGMYDLYLGYPFLSGTLTDGTYIQAPLFLYPVRLERRDTGNRSWSLHRGEGDPQLNRTLMLALKKFHRFQVEDTIYDEAEEQALKGDIGSWTQWLRDHGLDLTDPDPDLSPLPEYKKEEIPEQAPLTLNRYVVLGNFPQGNSAILRDYEELMDRQKDGLGMVEELLRVGEGVWEEGDGKDPSADGTEVPQIPERERFYLLPADASQERILRIARTQNKLVIDGPPGTGKSQVIVNLIGDALAQGKKVLLVCQKRAALDVVYQRLDGLGLSSFVALVHDEKNDRKELYGRIQRLLAAPQRSTPDPSSHLEALCRQLEDREAKLNAVKKGLYERHSSGFNAFELYSRAKPLDQVEETVDLSGVLKELDRYNLEDSLREVATYASFYQRFGRKEYPLKERKPFASLDLQAFSMIRERLEEIYRKAQETEKYLEDLDHEKVTPAYVWLVSDRLEKIYPNLGTQEKNALQKLRLWWWTSFTGKGIIEELMEGEPFKGTSSTEWPKIRESLRVMYEMGQTTEQMARELEKLRPYFQDALIDRLKKEIAEGNIPTTELLQKIEHLTSDFDDLREMDRFFEQTSSTVQTLITRVREKVGWQSDRLPECWTDTIRQTVYIQWLDEIEKKHPLITKVSSEEYEEIRRSYKELIREKRDVARRLLVRNITEQVRKRQQELPKAAKELQYQVGKKRQVWPLRKLVRHFSQSGLLDLMPVWLTAPETLSSIFPLKKDLFDLVIFDEASQCTVENGLPSVYRGRQVIVAGDEKQLPPSTHFRGMVSADDEEEPDYEMEESESLLNLAKRIFPGRMLQWHYRSHSQELIHFSNHAFYQGMMEIAPNVRPYQEPPAIRWVKVDGRWINRCNEREATEVVDQLKEQLTTNPGQTVGVITFNSTQRDLIEEEIDGRVQDDPEFAELYQAAQKQDPDRRVFIKNIENVQGDERDMIIFSIGYARNEKGQVLARFGSLNAQGGENRLNVAITRAKQQIVVIASIEPHELKVAHTTHQGPKLFRHYLEYAQAVSNMDRTQVDAVIQRINEHHELGRQEKDDQFDSIFEEQVCDAMRQMGYQVDTQVGVSGYRVDMAVLHPEDPERYILGIECDGAMYHSSRDARERDVYRQEFLESKGWTITRIWSRNWWRNPSRELERIDHEIRRLVEKDTKQRNAPQPIPKQESLPEKVIPLQARG